MRHAEFDATDEADCRDEAALLVEGRRLAAAGRSQREIASALGKSRHWVRYNLTKSESEAAAPATSFEIDLAAPPLEFHRLANVFPLIEGPEFDELVADIKAQGQHENIVVLDGMVLDGRNRYRACVAAGIAPRAVTFRPEVQGDSLAFVISKNLKRRQLTDDQRRYVAAKIANLSRGRPDENAATCGISRAEAARLVNVDEAGTERARTVIANGAPALVRAVEQGRLSISQAAIAVRLPREQQERVAAEAEAMRANTARAIIKRGIRAAKVEALGAKQRDLPDRRYGVILADWPRKAWAWSDETGSDRAPDNHYATQTFRWAIDFAPKIQALAAPDCALFMWTTAASLLDDIEIMAEWGFCALRPRGSDGRLLRDEAGQPLTSVSPGGGTYRSHQVWDKVLRGMGRWFIDCHELVMIGVRGNIPAPVPGTQELSLFSERRGAHSAKPDFVAAMIERLWPDLPKVELFRRGAARPGWDCWGAECAGPELPPVESEMFEAAE